MKRLWLGIVLVLLWGAVALARQPPSFENQQFLGTVTWDVNRTPTPVTVVAQLASGSYSSALHDTSCSSVLCMGIYGKQADNILRVQGTAGQLIRFYVGEQVVGNTTYVPDAVTTLHFNLSVAFGNGSQAERESRNGSRGSRPGCVPDWLCGTWGVCEGDFQLRSCLDREACDLDSLTYNETRRCGENTEGNVSCSYQWQCTPWGACSAGQKMRSCQRTDDCDAQLTRKEVDRVITVPAEERKECVPPVSVPAAPPLQAQPPPSPPVPPRVEQPQKLAWYAWALPAVALVLAIGGFFFYRWKKTRLPEESKRQLSSYVQRHLQQGQSKEEIEDNLIRGGWGKKPVEKFLKKMSSSKP